MELIGKLVEDVAMALWNRPIVRRARAWLDADHDRRDVVLFGTLMAAYVVFTAYAYFELLLTIETIK